MAIGPYDYDGALSPELDEVEWASELPEHVEEWNAWWFANTLPAEIDNWFVKTQRDAMRRFGELPEWLRTPKKAA